MPRDHSLCVKSRQLVQYSAVDIRSPDTKFISVSGESNEDVRRLPAACVNESTEDIIGHDETNGIDRHYFTATNAEIVEVGKVDRSRRWVGHDPTRVFLPVVERNCRRWLDYSLPAPGFLSPVSKSIKSPSEPLLACTFHAPCTSFQQHFPRFSGGLEGHLLPPRHEAFPSPRHPQFWNLERQRRNLALLSSCLPQTRIQNGNCTEKLPPSVVNSVGFCSDQVSGGKTVFHSSAESSRYFLNTKPNRIWRPYDDVDAERNENFKRLVQLEI